MQLIVSFICLQIYNSTSRMYNYRQKLYSVYYKGTVGHLIMGSLFNQNMRLDCSISLIDAMFGSKYLASEIQFFVITMKPFYFILTSSKFSLTVEYTTCTTNQVNIQLNLETLQFYFFSKT